MSDLKSISVEEEVKIFQEHCRNMRKKPYDEQTIDNLIKILKRIDEKCPPLPHMALKPVRTQSTTVFDSKLGGIPYFPKEMEYPKVISGDFAGKPLILLAQINFEKLPHLKGFPEKGILQFFAGCDDDDYGFDYDDACKQNRFRIIYHENVIDDVTKLISAENMPEFNNECYPFQGEFLLEAGECELKPLSFRDYRFNAIANESYKELCDTNVNEQLYDALNDIRSYSETGLGGYPFFTQKDPRPQYQNQNNENYDILLFQLDSEFSDNPDDDIMWGDSGVGNFFISAQNLAKRDFSKVLYTWDCF